MVRRGAGVFLYRGYNDPLGISCIRDHPWKRWRWRRWLGFRKRWFWEKNRSKDWDCGTILFLNIIFEINYLTIKNLIGCGVWGLHSNWIWNWVFICDACCRNWKLSKGAKDACITKEPRYCKSLPMHFFVGIIIECLLQKSARGRRAGAEPCRWFLPSKAWWMDMIHHHYHPS